MLFVCVVRSVFVSRRYNAHVGMVRQPFTMHFPKLFGEVAKYTRGSIYSCSGRLSTGARGCCSTVIGRLPSLLGKLLTFIGLLPEFLRAVANSYRAVATLTRGSWQHLLGGVVAVSRRMLHLLGEVVTFTQCVYSVHIVKLLSKRIPVFVSFLQ